MSPIILTQVGSNIQPPFSSASHNVSFGWSVSINSDGRTVAIGAPLDQDVGRVYTYRFNDTADDWYQFGIDSLFGDQVDCEFGNSTDLSDLGDYLAVGARNHNNGRGQASVFVYDEERGAWMSRGDPIHGKAPDDNFGNVVSISSNGKRMAVGAAREDVGGNDNIGVVRVYEYNEGTRSWEQIGQDLAGKQAYEKFGFSIKLASNGQVLAVGAPFRHRSLNATNFKFWGGAVDVYRYENRRWVPMGKSIPYRNPVERFGWSVDVSFGGDVVAVGAPLNNDNGEASGQVRVYEFKDTDQDGKDWILRGNPIQGQDLGSWFGNTVGLSSDGLKVVTALWCDKPGTEQCDFGVRMYSFDQLREDGDWNQVGNDLPGKTRYDPYSTSAAMAKDDTILMTSVDLVSGETVVQTYKPE